MPFITIKHKLSLKDLEEKFDFKLEKFLENLKKYSATNLKVGIDDFSISWVHCGKYDTLSGDLEVVITAHDSIDRSVVLDDIPFEIEKSMKLLNYTNLSIRVFLFLVSIGFHQKK